MAYRWAGQIDSNPQVVGLVLLDQFSQHVGKAIDCIGGKALCIGEPRNGMVGTVNVGHPVYEVKFGCHGEYVSTFVDSCCGAVVLSCAQHLKS